MNRTSHSHRAVRRRFLGLVAMVFAGCGCGSGGGEPRQVDPAKAREAMAKRRGDFGERASKGKPSRKGG